jgi:hypothetical protein
LSVEFIINLLKKLSNWHCPTHKAGAGAKKTALLQTWVVGAVGKFANVLFCAGGRWLCDQVATISVNDRELTELKISLEKA